MNLTQLLKLLPIVGPSVANVSSFVDWFHEAAGALHPADQITAKAALKDVQADNDAGHARLQEKLAAAANK